jgi:hypothetical protein
MDGAERQPNFGGLAAEWQRNLAALFGVALLSS